MMFSSLAFSQAQFSALAACISALSTALADRRSRIFASNSVLSLLSCLASRPRFKFRRQLILFSREHFPAVALPPRAAKPFRRFHSRTASWRLRWIAGIEAPQSLHPTP